MHLPIEEHARHVMGRHSSLHMLGLVTPHAIASGKTAARADHGQEALVLMSAKHTRAARNDKIGNPQARSRALQQSS